MEPLATVVQEFLTSKRGHISPNTYRVYSYALHKFVQCMEGLGIATTDGLTERNLLKFAAWTAQQTKANLPNLDKAEKLSPAGVHVRLRPVRTFITWCRRNRIIAEDPFAQRQFSLDFFPRVPQKDLPVVRPEQFNRLLRAAAKSHHPLRDQAILTLLYATGMRASDLCNLVLSDFDQPNLVHVRASKGGKDRYIPIAREVKTATYKYIRYERPDIETDRVFISGSGYELRPMDRGALLQLLTRLCRIAKLPHLTPHAFRRGFVTAMDQQGVARTITQAVLGHTSAYMTDRYARLAQDNLIEALHRASPLKLAKRG